MSHYLLKGDNALKLNTEAEMREFKHTIKDKNGLHARPAGMLASVAKTFESEIRVEAQGKEADGKRLLSLMSLGAKYGAELHFIIEGKDEDVAEKALIEHCSKSLNGDKSGE